MKNRVLEAGGRPGYLLALTAPYGPQDYGYMIAIFAFKSPRRPGEIMALAKQRPALLKAIAA
jgi:hypothetical protein